MNSDSQANGDCSLALHGQHFTPNRSEVPNLTVVTRPLHGFDLSLSVTAIYRQLSSSPYRIGHFLVRIAALTKQSPQSVCLAEVSCFDRTEVVGLRIHARCLATSRSRQIVPATPNAPSRN